MKSIFPILLGTAVVLPLAIGCEPRPVVEEPPAEPPAVEEPAVDVNVNPNGAPGTEEKTGVDVEVGGGQGVQVDVGDTPAQQ